MDISGFGARMGLMSNVSLSQNYNTNRADQNLAQDAGSIGMSGSLAGQANDTSTMGRKPVQSAGLGDQKDSITISGKDLANKAVAEMKQDDDLEQFAVFVRSGETSEPQRYQEDWMRPTENFIL